MTEPDPVKRQDVGGYGQIDVEARMLETDRDIGRLDQEPIILLLDVAEVKLDQIRRRGMFSRATRRRIHHNRTIGSSSLGRG